MSGAPSRPPVAARPVTTFIRRSPRMNDSQSAAWRRLGDRFLVPGLARGSMTPLFVPQPPIDLDALFGHPAPLLVEIGTGSGENLAAVAGERPEWNLLGFEVYAKVLGSTMSRLERAGCTNVRLIDGDAVTGLQHLLAPGSISELHTYFPDPWHKSRHAKRRLVNDDFAQLVATRLVPGGLWRLATDWPDYAAHIRKVFGSLPQFENVYPGGAPRDGTRPVTKFEARAVSEGRTVTDFVYARIGQVQP